MNTNTNTNTNTKVTEQTEVDTVIVGGGQAGLALGYHLAQQKRDFVILDAHGRVGDAWRTRWDSLRLFTPTKYDGLPGMPFPGDRNSFPTKDDEADYLEDYAARFRLPVHTDMRVDRLWPENDRYVVTSGTHRWVGQNVVVATGGCQKPRLPAFAAELGSDVVQLHSSAYRNPGQLQPGAVLVVGLGNSGAEIARELSRTHPTWLAGRPSAELPIRHGRMAARFALPLVRFLGMHVLTLGTPIGRRSAPNFTAHAAPLIRTKLSDLTAAGVRPTSRVAGVSDGKPLLEGDQVLDVANVIWCTGYREEWEWVDAPVFDAAGRPQQLRGVVESAPGLYFLGLEFMFAAASATVTGACRDAKYLAKRINVASPRPTHSGVSQMSPGDTRREGHR
ncbi:NAD(P)/FAD-dependent oxidoreductase [Leifsonia kafniensis]|uniref:NAD(P)/FAD-dependent oxidoreductase n=1 Tax=Leifsonia kafniensis TaxID=475957 RepID=A0ABP7K702_9MICO